MPNVADVLERESRTIDLDPGDFERLLGRRERKQRNRRIRAGVVGVVVALAAGFVLVRSLTSDGVPANPPVEPTPTPTVVSGALAYGSGTDIYVADPDGSNAVKITDGGPAEDCGGVGDYWTNQFPKWSPDGSHLAFEHACSASLAVNVMVTDPQGNVVAEFPRDGWDFEWSPDSTRVAVWGSFGETIDIYGLDGVRQVSLPIPSHMAPHYDSGPGEWMPDGSALVLYGVFAVPVDGSAPYDLGLGDEASYSPDGSRIAVRTGRSIAVLDADGAPVSEVDAPLEGMDAWSPDGSRFASVTNDELSVVDAATGAVTPLPEAMAALDGGTVLDVEGFSPDGDRILYMAADVVGPNQPLANQGLWSIGVDGSDPHFVVSTTVGEWRPV